MCNTQKTNSSNFSLSRSITVKNNKSFNAGNPSP